MSKTVEIFIALLRSAMNGTNETIELSDANFESLYSLAKFHDLAHIIFFELNKRGALLEGELYRKFKNQFDIALYRHIKREATTDQLREILENAHIPFVLLKGSYLKALYPEAWMRTSSDIDILVRENSIQKAEKLFIEAGMKRGQEGQYDVSFDSDYHIELHYTTIEDYTSAKQSEVMCKAWDYFEPKSPDSSELVMRDEMFYFYHVAHMAKHFRNGGNGVRTIIDTWLLNHKIAFAPKKRDALLEEGGLKRFSDSIKKLSEIWFSNQERVDSISELEEYIISGGIYGTKERSIAASKQKTGSKIGYFFKRVFLPLDKIKHSYPILKKFPFFLPACWIIRWFRLFNPKTRKRMKDEINYANAADNSTGDRIERLMKQLEIW